MPARCEYFFDYVSPYSYLANSQIEGLAERTGAEIVYRPMFLGGVMQSSGNAPPATVPAKGAYMLKDLQRWAEHYGLPLNFNPAFPINTLAILRAALVAQEDGCFRPFHEAMFRAMWVEPVNLGDKEILRDALEKAGLDGARILARTAEQDVKDRLRANTDEAVERGAFGAPTFFVGDAMFFGNDRIPFLEPALVSA